MKTIALIFSLAAANAFADFQVTNVSQSEDKVTIKFATTEIYDSICRLSVESVSVSTPYHAFREGLTSTEAGVVELSVGARPEGRCFRTGGVHSGSASFSIGNSVPELSKGKTYILKINHQKVGKVKVQ